MPFFPSTFGLHAGRSLGARRAHWEIVPVWAAVPSTAQTVDFALDDDYVFSLQPLGALLDREFDLLTFFQSAETVTADFGKMDEDIRPIVLGQEAVSLAAVEPLDGSANSF
jgi:hypothetical protein